MKTQRKEEAGVKVRLIEAAERLFAERGLEGVSLREIAAAAGQGNHSVVQYHFGGKENLVREIIAHRISGVEPMRRELLEKLKARKSGPDVKSLLEVLHLTITAQADEDGRHPYARFMLQYLTLFRYAEGMEHPGWSGSAAAEALELLSQHLSTLPADDLYRRLTTVSSLLMTALVERDNSIARGHKVPAASAFYGDLFNMMEAAMKAPLPIRKI